MKDLVKNEKILIEEVIMVKNNTQEVLDVKMD